MDIDEIEKEIKRELSVVLTKLATIEAAARQVCFSPLDGSQSILVRVCDLYELDALIGDVEAEAK